MENTTAAAAVCSLTMKTSYITDMVKMSTMLGSLYRDNLENRCIYVEPCEGNKAKLRITDRTFVWCEREVDTIPSDSPLKEAVVINSTALSRILPACTSEFTLIHRDGGYYAAVDGGDIWIDNINNNLAHFAAFPEDTKKTASISGTELTEVLQRLLVVANTASIAEQAFIFFNPWGAYAVSTNNIVRYEFEKELPNIAAFGLRRDFARILLNLLTSISPEEVRINSQGTLIYSDSFKFCTARQKTKSQLGFNDMITEAQKEVDGKSQMLVNLPHISKIADMANSLDYSLGRLELGQNSDGQLFCKFLTKRTDSQIILSSTMSEEITTPTNTTVQITTSGLKTALNTFSREKAIAMSLTSQGIVIKQDNYIALALSLATR